MVTVKSIIEVFALISGEYGGLGSLVVMYIMNPLRTSHSLSPTNTFSMDPDLMKFFSNTLSNTGSSSMSISSISNGLPEENIVRKHYWHYKKNVKSTYLWNNIHSKGINNS